MSGISEFLKNRIERYRFAPISYYSGTVSRVGDGVVRVASLPERRYGELLEFENGVFGMALELTEDGVGAVLFDADETVSVGSAVRGTGTVAQMPVGDLLLGRVVDPIGRPLDGRPLEANTFWPAERSAPAIIDRRPVDTPLQTGILAIDSMIPIGRGQRELIIGDRQTGKTTIAVDAIMNQKNTGVLCVYCSIGQKASTVAGVIETLSAADAMAHTVVVSATAAASPAMQYLAPYCACTIAEFFAAQGKDVLVVYDDLSKHAVAYRTMSLLLLRPPGREAYPGDVFYLHSRLLERSACLSLEKGGGSITALPIVETMAGNISAYIPTNIISITDGQIYLESELFHADVRPAVNTGLSVSRVGRAAQDPAMRAVSGTLRIELAQYREMAVFARFGSEVDAATKTLLTRGENLINLLKQNKASPYSVFDEVFLLLAYDQNLFRTTPVRAFSDEIKRLLVFADTACPAVKERINGTGTMTEEDWSVLIDVLKRFEASA